MRFLYKIHSNFDGFRPAVIDERLAADGRLRLGWRRYIDDVEEDSEIWVYFHGRHSFENGVYIKGVPDEIDVDGLRVFLHIQEYSTTAPLTDAQTTQKVAAAVATRFRQVFLMPDALVAPTCLLATTAASCANRQCDSCATWKGFPLIEESTLQRPPRLPSGIGQFVPAYWVIPRRSFILQAGRKVQQGIKETSELFKRFKTGQKELTYPLALAMAEQLDARGLDQPDAIVPIPLSPDKAKLGEINRTKLLAEELSKLIDAPVVELLSLNKPIGKRRLRISKGVNAPTFEMLYRNALEVDGEAAELDKILLLDDVCTEGSTLRAASARIRDVNADCEICAVTAGQMIIRPAVADEQPLLAE